MNNPTSNDDVKGSSDDQFVKPDERYVSDATDIDTNTNISEMTNVRTAYIDHNSELDLKISLNIENIKRKSQNYHFNKR